MTEIPAPRPAPGLTEYALLLALGITWGTSYLFTKVAVAEVTPFTLVAVRTTIAAALLLLLIGLQRGRVSLTLRDLAAFALVGLVSNALPLSLISLSASYVDSSVVATSMALVPLITMCLTMLSGQYPTRRAVLGIAIGLVGIGILFGPSAFLSFGDSAKGALCALGASVVFSCSLIAMGLVRHHGSMQVAAFSLVAAAVWSVLMTLVFEGLPTALPSHKVMAAVIVLAVLNTGCASLLLFALVPRAGALFTSINNYLVPVIALLCGAVFLAEQLTAQKIWGVAVVLAGIAVSTFRRRPVAVQQQTPPPA
ncbi:EamA-like transporter family [Hoeflea sp. IMCC20628]|uniref:DMT family transporter n=1 Tax=Hoeflea sp. IMCC20628 TaxID=1620421 RepID=UPI00063BEDA8|nr:EamA family transporter [Hoeflea sp. IMCC20628]AKH98836.1 EamA-like transporter family [Hoeflea sp. IMCC20628]